MQGPMVQELIREVNNYTYLADTTKSVALKNKFIKRATEAERQLLSITEEDNEKA